MRGKRRPPEERVSNVAGPLPPCRVCGEQAAGFHYGVNTCEACKGFFRRCLLRKGDYECIGNGDCDVDKNRRNSCPKCRYVRCLAVGMSKDAIKTGRYTHRKRTLDTLEIRRLQEIAQSDQESRQSLESTSAGVDGADHVAQHPSLETQSAASDDSLAHSARHTSSAEVQRLNHPLSYERTEGPNLSSPMSKLTSSPTDLVVSSPESMSPFPSAECDNTQGQNTLNGTVEANRNVSTHPPSQKQRVAAKVAHPLPPCKICGEQAAGFHYGVNTCEACKGFFRRSLLRKGAYECLGNGDCDVEASRRKSCPKCRYLKCLAAGMSKEAIKTGRYTLEKRTKDTLEIKKLKKSTQEIDNTSEVRPTELSSGTSCVLDLSSAHTSHLASPAKPGEHETDSTGNSVQQLTFLHHQTSLNADTGQDYFEDSMDNVFSATRIGLEQSPAVSSEATLNPVREIETEDLYLPGHSSASENLLELSPLSLNDGHSVSSSCVSSCSGQKASYVNNSGERMSSGYCSSNMSGMWSAASPQVTMYSPQSLISDSSPCPTSPPCGQPWHDYDEEELDEMIDLLVTSHRQLVVDCNSLSDEYLEQKFKECLERCILQEEMFGPRGMLDRREAMDIYRATGLDVDGYLAESDECGSQLEEDTRQIIAFMKLIPGFKSLGIPDQTNLVKACIMELILLAYFRGYRQEDWLVVETTKTYCIHEMKRFYDHDFLEVLFHITGQLKRFNLTYDAVVILKAVCIFFPDRVDLIHRDDVERIHQKLVQCLLLLLRRTFPETHGRVLSRIISLLTAIRSFDKECRLSLCTLTGNRPILVELFRTNVL